MSNKKVPESIAQLTFEFASLIKELYGDRLSKVILFGSYARGDQHEESDVDFLVVLNDKEVRSYREISHMSSVTFDLTLKYSRSVSAIPVSEERLLNKMSPMLVNAHKDGIIV